MERATSASSQRVSQRPTYSRKEPNPSTSSDDFEAADSESLVLADRLRRGAPVATLPEESSMESMDFVCQRCLREFDSHERHRFEQHVAKCKD